MQLPLPPPKPTQNDALIATFKAIAHILSIRLFLLLAVIGAFVLAFMAMSGSDVHSTWILGVYSAFTVIPLTVWDLLTRRQNGSAS